MATKGNGGRETAQAGAGAANTVDSAAVSSSSGLGGGALGYVGASVAVLDGFSLQSEAFALNGPAPDRESQPAASSAGSNFHALCSHYANERLRCLYTEHVLSAERLWGATDGLQIHPPHHPERATTRSLAMQPDRAARMRESYYQPSYFEEQDGEGEEHLSSDRREGAGGSTDAHLAAPHAVFAAIHGCVAVRTTARGAVSLTARLQVTFNPLPVSILDAPVVCKGHPSALFLPPTALQELQQLHTSVRVAGQSQFLIRHSAGTFS
eukprot:COSAG05_NODE_1834_length_3997_cov_127.609131_2_plen_267_part_00